MKLFDEKQEALGLGFLASRGGFSNFKCLINWLLNLTKELKNKNIQLQTVKHIQYVWSGLGDLF